MKKLHCFISVTIGLLSMSSCSQDDSELNKVANQVAKSEALISSDSLSADSIITPLIVNPDSMAFYTKAQTRALTSMSNYDENFSSNMYAIRELPVSIQARGQANTSNRFLSANGSGKEVVLMGSARTVNQRFYLKILPASSGIPYLIYSSATGTPLSVGQYGSNTNNKVLFLPKDNSGSLTSAGWDLIPSTYQGYFAIQSQFYLGQSDPNNMWSIFNYSLEVINDNKVGYAQYTKKAQQEFLITPVNGFKLQYIEFYKDGATVTKQSPLKVTTYSENPYEERRPFTIKAKHYEFDTSSFSENSFLKIPITNAGDKFYRPIVKAEKFVPPLPVKPSDDPSPIRDAVDMIYSSATQKIENPLTFEINGIAAPNSLIEVTSYLENYRVSAKYTAHMTYNFNGEEREVKISGTWYGTIYTTIRDNNYPNDIIKYFDLDDGEEILRTRSSVALSPITFK